VDVLKLDLRRFRIVHQLATVRRIIAGLLKVFHIAATHSVPQSERPLSAQNQDEHQDLPERSATPRRSCLPAVEKCQFGLRRLKLAADLQWLSRTW
jgi:hypothetical protein